MARSDVICGLDIGTTKTATVIASVAKDGSMDVTGFGVAPSFGLRKGVVTDLEETVKSVEAAIENAERMAGVHISDAFVGITGEHIKSLNSHGIVAVSGDDREVVPLDVKRVVDASTIISLPAERQLVHSLPREYLVDGQNGITDPIGMSAARLEVDTHIVTAGSSFVANVLKCVHRAGIEPRGVIFEPLAAGAAVLLPEERNAGVVLIDIGGGTSDIAVYWGGGVYHTWTVPVGGNIITNDIALGLKTSFSEAENIKQLYGTADVTTDVAEETFEVKALSGRTTRSAAKSFLRQIIVARMNEIFKIVRANLAENCPPEVMLAELVLTGGGAQLAGIDVLAADFFDLPARIGVPMHVGGLTDTIKHPAYAATVGLVLFGAKADGALQAPHRNGKSPWSRVSSWVSEIFG
ncbi:MAG: cell division protein FtsA [Candidatus Eremiobacter antarcticus]|nr:cell division protein FtsA [Candidatus Eremiobacteraeota bacterium]MBC5807255.1 cell division protein FtsA [Candidatus Eremiobacteraeota bacterium]PZR61945.1 MAG: cell division protein FtsA [Candidatus Eremiobacter sp. RRmetagenome_bin22]